MGHSIKFSLKTICAAIFDCSTVLLFASTLFRFLILFLPVKRFAIIQLVCLLYFTFFYVYRQQTLGQSAFGIALITKDKKRPTLVQIFIRVFTKAMICCIIPTSLLFYSNPTFILTLFPRSLLLLSLYFSLIVIVLIVFKLLFKQNVWNLLSRTKKIDIMYSKQKFAFSFLILLCFTTCCWTCMFVWNNSGNPSKQSILGFSYPFKYIEPPSNHLTLSYINHLKKEDLSPKEYILSLFDNYDIVVLEECSHRQQEEWDLIYSIVTDSLFVSGVGTIFTEYGNACDQNDIDSLINRVYATESELEMAIPQATHIMTYSYFNFLKRINLFNAMLPDSVKLKVFACDILKGKYFLTHNQVSDNSMENRDSLMAQPILEWYQKTKRKCLVVTNYRHSFAYRNPHDETTKDLHLLDNQAQYIFDLYPDKFANVLYFGGSPMISPLQFANGQWGVAFKKTHYAPKGFSLQNSPFGEDGFDMFRLTKQQQNNVKYKDMFTGIVFQTPENTYLHEPDFPENCIENAIQKEYNKLIQKGIIENGERVYSLFSQSVNDKSFTLSEMLKTHQNSTSLYEECAAYLLFSWWHYLDVIIALLLECLTIMLGVFFAIYKLCSNLIYAI